MRCKPLPRDGIVPSRLYCTNADVDGENVARLAALASPAVRVAAADTSRVCRLPVQRGVNRTSFSSVLMRCGFLEWLEVLLDEREKPWKETKTKKPHGGRVARKTCDQGDEKEEGRAWVVQDCLNDSFRAG